MGLFVFKKLHVSTLDMAITERAIPHKAYETRVCMLLISGTFTNFVQLKRNQHGFRYNRQAIVWANDGLVIITSANIYIYQAASMD